MALYENLPIYKKAVALVVFMETAVANFSRYHRYAIGADMRTNVRRLAPGGLAGQMHQGRTPSARTLSVAVTTYP